MAEREKVKIEIEAYVDPTNSVQVGKWNELADAIRFRISEWPQRVEPSYSYDDIDLMFSADRLGDTDE